MISFISYVLCLLCHVQELKCTQTAKPRTPTQTLKAHSLFLGLFKESVSLFLDCGRKMEYLGKTLFLAFKSLSCYDAEPHHHAPPADNKKCYI